MKRAQNSMPNKAAFLGIGFSLLQAAKVISSESFHLFPHHLSSTKRARNVLPSTNRAGAAAVKFLYTTGRYLLPDGSSPGPGEAAWRLNELVGRNWGRASRC
jgi:hypothetical protein